MSDSESDHDEEVGPSHHHKSPNNDYRKSNNRLVDSDEEEKVVEDEDEDEYDSEEEEEMEDKPKKKRRRGTVSDFILEEADVDDDEDEDDIGDGESDFEEYKNDLAMAAQEEGPSARDIEGERRMNWRNADEKNLEDYFKKKYSSSTALDKAVDGDPMIEEITQTALLPTIKDANLWLVKCRQGEEKSTVLLLMRKLITYQHTDDPMHVHSVIAKEGLKGFIYIESIKQSHVKKLIEGVGTLQIGKYQQTMVKREEMPSVLRVTKETNNLKSKQWVRLKKGVFKDDLAMVDYVDPSQNMVFLKLIPRIDYSRNRGVMKSTQNGTAEKRKIYRRPPQKPFDPEAIRAIGGEVANDGDFMIFEGNRYNKGFLYKNFNINAIIIDGVTPTLSELEKFDHQPEAVEVKSLTEAQTFVKDDVVEVVEGAMTAMQGKVIKIDGKRVTIQPSHVEFKAPLTFESCELRKYFKVGDHVKVMRGSYEGETGMVVRVEENLVILLSDTTMSELKVLPKDLQLCTEVASGVDSKGKFSFDDLVEIDPQTVGVIVRIEKDFFKVLDMYGKERQLSSTALTKKKDNKFVTALDSEDKHIRVKDIVKVIDGPHSGRQGEIRHLFRSFAFIYSRKHIETSGIFVCKTRNLVVADGSKTSSAGPINGGMGGMFVPMSPRLSSPAHPGGGSGGRGGRGRGGHNMIEKKNKSLIGRSVRIILGPYKSYVGIVKDTTESTARVELHTNCKIISVDISRLKVMEDGALGSFSSYDKTPMTSQTPMHSGSRTPMYGSQTPMMDGSRTPHYGGSTPHYESGSYTPGRSSAWDPGNPNTPSRPNDFDDMSYLDESGLPGPYTPQPGGTSFSPYPGQPTPSPLDNNSLQSPGQYDLGSMYQGTPSPMTSFSPMTPGAPFTPSTPGLDGAAGSDWVSLDLFVKIKESHDDKDVIGKVGIVKSINGDMCALLITEKEKTATEKEKMATEKEKMATEKEEMATEKEEMATEKEEMATEKEKMANVNVDDLEPEPPGKSDRVKVIRGDVNKDLTGTLLSIDQNDGIVKLDVGKMAMVQLSCLCKSS
ncbi:hypothetical protein HELRODRAFT_192720 [Helobdella robusta]|uniref:Transcription elongation factor SPT5 n=1 Tax=Helobdella robusta TaxID=6412 RepID=T1FU80_HELRO|nr:hypothetical protein HELRODRAFT_192720 [Helobdella robusta]ESO00069.1 hypothetical protein HELRODRAFT_192720 [Helobdella robusta]